MEKTDAVAALAALAQDSRLDVFRLLAQAGAAGLAAGTIAERLGLPAATLSFHLSHLKHAGLIAARRDGRSLIYAAEYKVMNALLAHLTEMCCQADPAGRAPAGQTPVIMPARTRHETPARARQRQ